eukprot:8489656-Karenia_brevis.AAC.1
MFGDRKAIKMTSSKKVVMVMVMFHDIANLLLHVHSVPCTGFVVEKTCTEQPRAKVRTHMDT